MMKLKSTLLLFCLAFVPFAVYAAKLNVNTASAADLEALSGIGPAKAEAIVEYRSANGPFASIDDLTKVSGIGERTVEQLREDVAVK